MRSFSHTTVVCCQSDQQIPEQFILQDAHAKNAILTTVFRQLYIYDSHQNRRTQQSYC